jgi:hypothetical protein
MTRERWAAIPGYENLYMVSNLGRVWSMPRTVESTNRWGVYRRTVGGCFKVHHKGQVALSRGGTMKFLTVAHLVAQVFGGQP